jgi:hypothetical protein
MAEILGEMAYGGMMSARTAAEIGLGGTAVAGAGIGGYEYAQHHPEQEDDGSGQTDDDGTGATSGDDGSGQPSDDEYDVESQPATDDES